MKFSLTFWIADPDGMDNVKSEVMLALWDAFKREGIRVPYPVREIRIRGGALPVEPWSRFPARCKPFEGSQQPNLGLH